MGRIETALSKVLNKVDGFSKTMNKIKDDSTNNPSKQNHSKTNTVFSFGIKISIFLAFWIYTMRYSGLINDIFSADNITYFIIDVLKFLSPEIALFGTLTNHDFLQIIAAWVGVVLWIDIPWAFFWIGFFDGGKINETWQKIFKWQFLPPLFALIGLLAVQGIVVNFNLNNENVTAGDIADDTTTSWKESQTVCLLTHALSGDLSACEKIKETKKATESERTKYEIELLALGEEIYNHATKNKIYFDYEFLTQGGKIKIDKFECYKNSKKDSNKIGETQTFEDKVVIANSGRESERFFCDLSSIENPKPEEKAKIIPVLYYTIDSEITQELPIVNMQYQEGESKYIENRNKFRAAFDNLAPVISNNIFAVSTRWYPKPPIFANSNELDTTYNIGLTIQKGSSVSVSQYGKILSTKITKFSIPELFESNCGEQNPNCDQELIAQELNNENKVKLDINLKLKKSIERESIGYLILNTETQMEIKHSRELKIMNANYVEPSTQKDNSTSTQTKEIYWENKESELNIIKLENQNNKANYPQFKNDIEDLEILIEEGFEVINEGKILENKEELSSTENSRNLKLKTSYSNIKDQINKIKVNIDNKIKEIQGDNLTTKHYDESDETFGR